MKSSTNKYYPIYQAKRQKTKPDWEDKYWEPVDTHDIRAYIGIRMLMAINQMPSIDDYWSSNPLLRNGLISNTMTRNMFKHLTRYFHVNDPTKDPSRAMDSKKSEKKKRKDPLYKVSPLMEQVRKNSLLSYNLHKEVAIDEAMVKCHGQHLGIVGALNKPAKRGFKIFMISDSITGYTSNFQVYMRAQNETGLTQKVVENLTEDIQGFNHVVFIDKFYTSVPLAVSLLRNKIYVSGSFNTSRRFWPKDLKINKKFRKKDDKIRNMRRGDYMVRQSTCGKLTATVWKDSKPVFNLSTCYEPTVNKRKDVVQRKTIDNNGKWKKQEVVCPPPIVQFNQFMGAVDRHDHLRGSYTLQRQSTKWWTYFCWFAVDLALINSYIVYKETHPKIKHKDFQLQVAQGLIGGYTHRKRLPRQQDPSELDSINIHGHECILISDARPRMCRHCKLTGQRTDKGRIRESSYACMHCGVNLHRDCFLPYHTAMLKKTSGVDVSTQTELIGDEPVSRKKPKSTKSEPGKKSPRSVSAAKKKAENKQKAPAVPTRHSPRKKLKFQQN